MDIYKLKFTLLDLEIFAHLSVRAGQKLSQREISKNLSVSPTAVANSVKNLLKGDLIKLEKLKSINLISLNRDNPKAIQLKKVENIKNIYVSGLADELEEALAGSTLILFGSYLKGEDTVASDIDFAVIGRKPKQLNLEFFEKRLERQININFYHSFKEIHKNLKNNILSGLVIFGGINL
jgi:predicted nucleotidyltransferase